ncbi:MAG: START domain-containing protein [Bacteroidetes bacterium]|nr:START domain-containing protein [Bacteroidota bacterium]MDA1120657.1 START domain-containing protein [Bacteroidota bacterium]
MRCFVLLLSLSSLQGYSQNDGWDLEKNKDGVKVYTRIPAGEIYKEFRAVTTLESTLSSAIALLGDMQAAPDWYAHVKQGKVLKKYNSLQSMVHIELDLPFPADDRDLVALFDFTYDSETGIAKATVTGEPNFAPNLEKSIRIPRLNGFWEFIPIGDTQTEVHYQVFSDPGGNLPIWIFNSMIADDPFRSLRNMQSLVKLEKYQNATIDFITERR